MDYKIKEIQTGEKDYNTKMILEFSDIDKIYCPFIRVENVNFWWNDFTSTRNLKNRNLNEEFKDLLRDLYTSGYGFKTIAASIPNASYTQIRGLFNKIFPDIVRKGTSVTTDKLKQRRSERLLKSEDNPWKHDLNNKNSTGIQGRYKDYWLRSTYEYIYVKWMERNGINFKSEPTKFKLNNGQYYTPDFSIYGNGILTKYVEIKGKVFDNNLHKPELLSIQIGKPVIIVDDITPYCEVNYERSLKEWKKYLKDTNQKVIRKGIKP